MPNKSQLKERRFWERWRKEGKVGTYWSSNNLVVVVQKAFALAINEMMPMIRPQAQDIEVTVKGSQYHCRWNKDDLNGTWITIEGDFYRYNNESVDQGCVCICYVWNWVNHSYPCAWSYLYDIHQMYEMMHNAPVHELKKINYEDIECPGCKEKGAVCPDFIPGDACFDGDAKYCRGCGLTF